MEARFRNACYLAELVKFKLLPPATMFGFLKRLLDDRHNNDFAPPQAISARFSARKRRRA